MTSLELTLTDAFYKALELSKRKNVRLRDAAYMIAIQRVADACKLRGWL